MTTVRIGIIGIGGMGSNHARSISGGKVAHAEIAAVCDLNPERLDWARKELGEKVLLFDSPGKLFASNCCDAIIIATPHYLHPPLAIEGFKHGLHVLTEKPAGVYTKQVREMNEAAAAGGKVFAIMFNQRTNPVYAKLKEMIAGGELGEIRRTNWIITTWYRSQSYFDSGGWRATWKGEGGGVLLNQSPHQIDLWQWICGMPSRVRAFCHFGKWHNIEVEDDVTAYVEYPNGATGVFVTSTADAPGTNRLEITGNMGKIVATPDSLLFWKLKTPERQFNAEFRDGFGHPDSERLEIPFSPVTPQGHEELMNNWIASIQKGETLLAPGEEGIDGLTIINAMYLSSWLDAPVDIPFDEDLYFEKLEERIANSTSNKAAGPSRTMDVGGTFG